MKFKVGDKVIVTHEDHNWIYWIADPMDNLIGGEYIIVGSIKFIDKIHPTIIIEGTFNGLDRNCEEFAIPEACLESAIKPGEQLLFSFMKDIK